MTRFNISAVTASLLLVLLFCRSSEAAEVQATVGGAAVAIPAPKNLIALRNQTSPYYKLNAQMQLQVKNRLLAAFLPNSAAKIADGGAPHDADEWAIAFALGPNEAQVVTSGTFQRQFVPAIEQAYEKALADPAMRKKLDSTVDQGVDQAKRDY